MTNPSEVKPPENKGASIIEACRADLRDHYNTDFDTTVPGKEFDAEMTRVLKRHFAAYALSLSSEVAEKAALTEEQISKLSERIRGEFWKADLGVSKRDRTVFYNWLAANTSAIIRKTVEEAVGRKG